MNFFTRCRIAYKGNTLIKINPEYQEFTSFIENLPQIFDKEGDTIRCVRNHIKVLDVEGRRINVKRYGIPPYLIRRIIYVLFRDTKAKSSYDYALKLQSMGIDSPPPIGYYIQKKGIELSYCYLATVQEDNIYRLSDLAKVKEDITPDEILRYFGQYTAMLHNKGVFHHDYSMGNVLFRIEGGEPRFTLVDINRMSFHKATFDRGCKNFHSMTMTPQQFRVVSDSYAEVMGYDKERTYLKILSYWSKKTDRFNRKRWFKSKFTKRV